MFQIWNALTDPKLSLRKDAAEALDAGVSIIGKRGIAAEQGYLQKLLGASREKIARGPSLEATHGTLLTLRCVLRHGGAFVHKNFREICALVLKYKVSGRVCYDTVTLPCVTCDTGSSRQADSMHRHSTDSVVSVCTTKQFCA